MAGDIGTGIRTLLQTKSGVTNLLSTRIFPRRLPQNATLPAATFSQISGNTSNHATGNTTHAMARLQINAYASTHIAASGLQDAIYAELQHFSGTAGSETIDIINADTRRDLEDSPRDGSDAARYIVSQDYVVFYTSPTVNT